MERNKHRGLACRRVFTLPAGGVEPEAPDSTLALLLAQFYIEDFSYTSGDLVAASLPHLTTLHALSANPLHANLVLILGTVTGHCDRTHRYSEFRTVRACCLKVDDRDRESTRAVGLENLGRQPTAVDKVYVDRSTRIATAVHVCSSGHTHSDHGDHSDCSHPNRYFSEH